MATLRLILVLIAHAFLFPAEASSQFRAHASNQSAGISLALQATSPLWNTLGQAVQRFQDPTPPCKDAAPFAVPCDSYNLATILLSIIGNIFPAKTSDIFPTIFGVPTILSLSPDFAFYKLKVCPRGQSPRLHAVQCGPHLETCAAYSVQSPCYRLGDPSLSVSTGAADFDAQTRVLTTPITDNRWSWTADNSTWQGLSWSVSGSAVFNGALFPHFGYRVYFNEDYTFGQIVLTIRVVYVTVEVPVPVWDFRMYWQGNDSWRRKSYFLIWDLPSGDYYMRRIINGDGSKGAWYDKGWLTYRDAVPIAVGQQVFPQQ